MNKVVLENFDFVPFTGIGFISVFHDRLSFPSGNVFKFCSPIMLEDWFSKTDIPEKFKVLEPQAKFEVSFKRKKWIETYYYINFVFKKEYESEYSRWRKRILPESFLYFLEQYDEVEVPVCVITTHDPKEESGEQVYRLLHNFYENLYAFLSDKEEKIFVLSKCDCEQELLDIIQKAVSLEIHELLKKKGGRGLYPDLRNFRKYKVLYLSEELQRIYNEELNKAKEMFKLKLNEEV